MRPEVKVTREKFGEYHRSLLFTFRTKVLKTAAKSCAISGLVKPLMKTDQDQSNTKQRLVLTDRNIAQNLLTLSDDSQHWSLNIFTFV